MVIIQYKRDVERQRSPLHFPMVLLPPSLPVLTSFTARGWDLDSRRGTSHPSLLLLLPWQGRSLVGWLRERGRRQKVTAARWQCKQRHGWEGEGTSEELGLSGHLHFSFSRKSSEDSKVVGATSSAVSRGPSGTRRVPFPHSSFSNRCVELGEGVTPASGEPVSCTTHTEGLGSTHKGNKPSPPLPAVPSSSPPRESPAMDVSKVRNGLCDSPRHPAVSSSLDGTLGWWMPPPPLLAAGKPCARLLQLVSFLGSVDSGTASKCQRWPSPREKERFVRR